MDQDRELFKLQVAAQHYESSLEMNYHIFIALALGVLVFALGAVLSKQLPLLVGVLIWVMSVLAGGYVLLKKVREYDSESKHSISFSRTLRRDNLLLL